jgi:predicted RNA binding protein YcfA (HicA-like mRNA interferase family)
MSKAEKLAAKLLTGRSDKNFSFDDLCYLIDRAGFQLRRGGGSHRVYYKDGVAEIINVQPRSVAKRSLTKFDRCGSCS